MSTGGPTGGNGGSITVPTTITAHSASAKTLTILNDGTMTDFGALVLNMLNDRQGAVVDTVDIFHKSAGDAICVYHEGGQLPGTTFTGDLASGSAVISNVSAFDGLTVGTAITGTGIPVGTTITSAANSPGANQITMSANATATNTGVTITQTASGTPGDDAGTVVIIPQYLDIASGGDGRTGGTVKNNRTGMRGLKVVAQPPNSNVIALHLQSWTAASALYIENQPTTGGFSTGNGVAATIDDSNTATSANTLVVNRIQSAPAAGHAVVRINGTAAGTYQALTVADSGAVTRVNLYTDGHIEILQSNTGNAAVKVGLSGDTIVHFVQYGDGKLEWGDGTLARDTTLYRGAADQVKTDDQVNVAIARTLAGATGDLTGVIVAPTVNGAFTLTRLNYLECSQPAGAATITDAAVMQFDAAIGTHKAVDSGTTKTSPGTVTAWVKININGTIHYLPAYASKTT